MTPARPDADRTWWRPVLLMAAVLAVAHGFGRFSFPLVLPAMREDITGTYGAAGWLGTANFGSHLIGVLCVSVLARRVAATTMIKAGLVVTVTGLAVLAMASTFPLALIGMALTGLGASGTWVPGPGLVAELVPPERRGLAIGVLVTGVGIGIVVAGRVVAVVQSVDGAAAWRPVWAIEAILGGLLAVAVLVGLRTVVTTSGPAPERGLALRRLPRMGTAVTAYAAYGVVFTLYTGFLVAALVDDSGFSAGHAAASFSALGLTSIVGGLVLGRLSDRWGRPATLAGGFVGMAVCALLVLPGDEPWATLSAALFGLLMTGLGAVLAAYVADHLDPSDVGPAFGALTLCLGVTQLMFPPFGGWLVDRTESFDSTFLVAAVASVVGGAAASRFVRGRERRSPPLGPGTPVPAEPVASIS